MNLFRILTVLALASHLAWISWVALGWTLTRGRPVLRWLHIGSLIYAMVIVLFAWLCPLTLVEQWARRRAGLATYDQTFLEHYLDRLVYPDLPFWLVTSVSVAVCLFNLGTYFFRFRRRDAGKW